VTELDSTTNEGHSAYSCARAWVALNAVHSLISQGIAEALASTCGLTLNEFEALVFVQTAGPDGARLSDLAGAVPLSQPAISRLVARLEHESLLTRRAASDDGRSMLITLTARGLETLRKAAEVHAGRVHELLTGRISEADQRTMLAIFERIQGDAGE
jgi:DNA-binding MarR family transcriptional regulator